MLYSAVSLYPITATCSDHTGPQRDAPNIEGDQLLLLVTEACVCVCVCVCM